jgi:hypothetical protein
MDPDCAMGPIGAGYCLAILNRHQEAINSTSTHFSLSPVMSKGTLSCLTYHALALNQEALALFNREGLGSSPV